MKPVIHIVAVDFAGGIGYKGKLPWHHSDDLKHFKQTTMGHVVVMGRKTYEDIRSHQPKDKDPASDLLPGRTSYVVSNTESFIPVGATKVPSWRIVADTTEDDKHVFIIGGSRMFTETFPFTGYIFATVVKGTHEVDTYYPVDQIHQHFQLVSVKDKDGNVIAPGQSSTEPILFFEYSRTVEQQPPRIIKR